MSISTVTFLLPFSCLTGAMPLTCGLLPLTNDDDDDDGDDTATGSSSADVLLDGGVDTTATSLLLTLSGAGLLTTSAGCGDGNATSSSMSHALVSHKNY